MKDKKQERIYEMKENPYDKDFSQCYDAIVTADYYNHSAVADAIVDALDSRVKILELGIGTGLLAERLIDKGLDVSGFDFSKYMLELAVKRLGPQVKLYEQDVADLDLPDTYEASVSHGGVWIGIGDGEYMDSHITCPQRNLEGFRRVAKHLDSDGLLVICIQPDHKNCSEVELEGGAKYSSKFSLQGDFVYKQHLVQKDGKVLARHDVKARRFNKEDYLRMLDTAGFANLGKYKSDKLLVFQKKG